MGGSEKKRIALGYRLTNWLDIGIGYEDYISEDEFRGTDSLNSLVNSNENAYVKDLFYGINLHSEWLTFGISIGSGKGKYEYATVDGSSIGTSEVRAPKLAMVFKSSRGLLKYKVVFFWKNYGDNVIFRQIYGVEGTPFENLILAAGYVDKRGDSSVRSFRNAEVHLGAEYIPPSNKNLKLRAGIINREFSEMSEFYSNPTNSRNYTDLGLGIGYNWGRVSLEVAYFNYQNVLGEGNTFLACSVLLWRKYPYDYEFTPTDQRDSKWVGSLAYKF